MEFTVAPLPPELRALLAAKAATAPVAPQRSGSPLANRIRAAAKDDPVAVYATALERTQDDFHKRGQEYYFTCPLPDHQGPDDKPSCRLSPDKGLWSCDVCPPLKNQKTRGGDVIDLYAIRTGVSPVAAVAPLALALGLDAAADCTAALTLIQNWQQHELKQDRNFAFSNLFVEQAAIVLSAELQQYVTLRDQLKKRLHGDIKLWEQRVKAKAKELQHAQSLAAMLDASIGKNGAASLPGRDINTGVVRHEPWPEPVDGADLIDDVVEVITTYISAPPGAAETVALWIFHTWALAATDLTPRLILKSPEPGCGKSALYKLIRALARNTLTTVRATASALFRTIEQERPTIIMDEAEGLYAHGVKEHLLDILLGGFERGNHIMLTEGDAKRREVRLFEPFCPVATAAVSYTADAHRSRGFEVKLQRVPLQELPPALDQFKLRELRPHLNELASKIMRWTADNLENIKAVGRPPIPATLDPRARDIWAPLFAIAQVLSTPSNRWLAHAHDISLSVSGSESRGRMTFNSTLLGDIRDLFKGVEAFGKEGKRLTSADICAALNKLEVRGYAHFSPPGRNATPRAFDPHDLARILKEYNIYPVSMQPRENSKKRVSGYYLKDFSRAFASYLPEEDPGEVFSANSPNGVVR